jgi:hypothetical protein
MCELTALHGMGTAWARHGHSMLRVNRPLGIQDFEAPRISRQSGHEGGKVVSSTHWPPLPQEISLVLISVRGRVEITIMHIINFSILDNTELYTSDI